MDPLTHSLSGLVISRAGFYQKFGKIATITLLISALLPDIDHLTLRLVGPFEYLKYHRGITHSIFGGPILGFLFAGIVYLFVKGSGGIGYARLSTLSIIGIFTHIFLDLITSYGTQLFFPFSTKRYSLDLVFIIDLYLTSILLIPFLIITFKKKRARLLSTFSIAILLGYILLAYVDQTIAIHKGKIEAERQGIKLNRIEAIPMPLSPFRWSILMEDEKRYYQMNLSLLDGNFAIQDFEKRPLKDDLIKRVEELDIVKTYLWFARFPVVTVERRLDDYIVEYYDLRFNSLPPRRPFLLRLVVSEDGSLKKSDLLFHTLREE